MDNVNLPDKSAPSWLNCSFFFHPSMGINFTLATKGKAATLSHCYQPHPILQFPVDAARLWKYLHDCYHYLPELQTPNKCVTSTPVLLFKLSLHTVADVLRANHMFLPEKYFFY